MTVQIRIGERWIENPRAMPVDGTDGLLAVGPVHLGGGEFDGALWHITHVPTGGALAPCADDRESCAFASAEAAADAARLLWGMMTPAQRKAFGTPLVHHAKRVLSRRLVRAALRRIEQAAAESRSEQGAR